MLTGKNMYMYVYVCVYVYTYIYICNSPSLFKLHGVYLRNVYTSSNVIRLMKPKRMSWMENVAITGKIKIHVYKSLVRKPAGNKTPLGRQ